MGKSSHGGLRLIDTDKFFASLEGRLDERPRRLVVAALANALGARNVALVARSAGITRNVVYGGMDSILLKRKPLATTARLDFASADMPRRKRAFRCRSRARSPTRS